jgi:hypothetical protein
LPSAAAAGTVGIVSCGSASAAGADTA